MKWARQNLKGLTLVEVTLAILILAIASLGAMNYDYFAARQTKAAKTELIAIRLGQFLMEDWKSTGALSTYDPISLDVGITNAGVTDTYRVQVDQTPMFAELQYVDVADDADAGVTLREISVAVKWMTDYSDQIPGAADPSLTMTTYVRRDQAGG